ncbi:MAG: hypothetical protein IJU91_03640 [Selenomonadaceae bacterium]|nr:hypothetical protein [Selenomonadaceae bacterium]
MSNLNSNQLYEKFCAAKENYDLETFCDCIVDALKIRSELVKAEQDLSDELKEILTRGDLLVYRALKCLGDGDVEKAQFFIYTVVDNLTEPPRENFNLYYILGRVNYLAGNYLRAAKYFAVYDDFRFRAWQDFDELSFFYRANCFALLKRYKDAETFYTEALKIKSDFPEAKQNLKLVRQDKNDSMAREVKSLWNLHDWRSVPIFINARDRINVMKKLIDWLLAADYRNVIILDNDSTYPKLLEYYSELEKNSAVQVIKLKANLGYKALWKSNILEKLKISTPYVYTDPDVVPHEKCPKDFVRYLYEVLIAHKEFRKVGPSLIWEDITFFDKKLWQRIESDFEKQAPIEKNLCYANIDTTFALHSNTRNYSLRFSLRTLNELRLKHLPWYFDYENLAEDEKYYLEHADKSASLAEKFRNRN